MRCSARSEGRAERARCGHSALPHSVVGCRALSCAGSNPAHEKSRRRAELPLCSACMAFALGHLPLMEVRPRIGQRRMIWRFHWIGIGMKPARS